MDKQKKYYPVIDLLRIIAILGVIFIHTTTRTLEATSFNLQHFSWTLFLNQFFRFAVPMFFMISGFVLELSYPFHASYYVYLKKRINRILIPYIFWSAIYYYFVYTRHNIDFFQAILNGSSSYQLYFIPTLLIFYIIFPLIHKYYRVISHKWVLVFLGILQFSLLYFDYYVHPLSFSLPINIALLNFYIFLLGIIASHHLDKVIRIIKRWKILFFLSTIAVTFYIFFEGKNLYYKTHNYYSFYSQWRPSVLIYTVLLACSLYALFDRKNTHVLIIKKLSSLSFFVFFIHVEILELIWPVIKNNIFQKHLFFGEQLWFDPFFFLSVAVCSFLVAFFAHKIPKISKVCG